MSAITAQDVEDRYAQSEQEYLDSLLDDDITLNQCIALDLRRMSWLRVRDRVRAGGDPLICVMERE